MCESKELSRAERFWKESRLLAWALVLLGMCAAVCTYYFPQSPGVSIGMLACVAGIMSVRPDMHIAEKLAWIVVLVAFTTWEVRAIYRNDATNIQDLMRQNEQAYQT